MSRNGTIELVLIALAFAVLLFLKLGEKIDWSWWWVTVPLWGSAVVAFVVMPVVVILVTFFRRDGGVDD